MIGVTTDAISLVVTLFFGNFVINSLTEAYEEGKHRRTKQI